MDDKLQHVIQHLDGVVETKKGYQALCPAHDDHSPSLSIERGDRQAVVMICQSQGCSAEEIIRSIPDLTWRDFMSHGSGREEPVYNSRDAKGRLVGRVKRTKDKNFIWKRPNGEHGLGGEGTDAQPLYNAQAVSAVPRDEPILLVEGQGCADAANDADIPTVATQTGAQNTPRPESLEVLRDRTVVLWADNDDAGRDHMDRIGTMLKSLDCKVRWFEWEEAPDKGDVKDYLALGLDPTELKQQVTYAPEFHQEYDPMKHGSATFEADLAEADKLVDDYSNSAGGIIGIRTGIPKMDNWTKGLMPSHSYIVGATTGSGKSVLVGEIAAAASLTGHRVLLSMTEMKPVDYLLRTACYVAGVKYFKLRDGRATDGEKASVKEAFRKIASLSLFRDPKGAEGTDRLEAEIVRHGPELVIVDYIQEVRTPTSYSREREVATVMDDLKELARKYNVAMVVAAQLNRDAYGREPDINHIRESSVIGLAADDVWLLHRPDEGEENEEMYLYCRKSRHGKKGHFPVWFVPGQNWITDENPNGYQAPPSAQEGMGW